MRKTLTLPVRTNRGSFGRSPVSTGSYRIMLKPVLRKDRRRYYAMNSDGMFWTEFREEIAKKYDDANAAFGIASRIIANNARLRGRVEVVPA